MGVCLVTGPTAEGRARLARLGPGDWKRDASYWRPSPLARMPRETPRTYRDPAAPRTIATVRAELEKVNPSSAPEVIARGYALTPGTRMMATNDHWAIGVPGDGERPLTQEPWRRLGYLPAEAWRWYAPVRQLRPTSGAVYWHVEPESVRWAVTCPHVGEASASAPWEPATEIALPPGAAILADGYLWPLRGRRWEIWAVEESWEGSPNGVAMAPIGFVDPESGTSIVVMPMRP